MISSTRRRRIRNRLVYYLLWVHYKSPRFPSVPNPPSLTVPFYVTSVLILSGEKAHSRACGGLPSQGKAFARTRIREFANPNGRNPDSSPDDAPHPRQKSFQQQKGSHEPQRIFRRRKSLRVGGREKDFFDMSIQRSLRGLRQPSLSLG